MRYGLPYRGSKSRIAPEIAAHLPSGAVFYDLFCGGCAVTHAAMLSGRWERFVVNDLQGDMAELFVNAANGKYRNEDRWISREDFLSQKDADAYVRVCWSFGNNGRSYLYGRGIEPYKRALHHAVVFGDFAPLSELCPEVVDACRSALAGIEERSVRRVEIGSAVVRWLKANGTPEMVLNNPLYRSSKFKGGRVDFLESLESLERLERLQSLESLQSLQSLQSLESLERLQSLESLQSLQRLQSLESLERLQSLQRYSTDYRDVPIERGGVVYCDPPYKDAGGYVTGAFDHDAFYDWARNAEFPVYVSEYSMPEDFIPVWEKPVAVLANQKGADGKVTERLYLHEKWANEVWKPTLF